MAATPASLPPPSEAGALLTRLGVREEDRGDVVEVWPTAQTDPELWWLLERCRGRVVAAMGDGDVALACPSLPAALGLRGRCFWIFVYAATVDDARRFHREHGVPDDVSWATLADLGQQVMLHRRRHGTTGLDLQWWLVLHFTGTIYALGRLQFHMHHLFRGPVGPPFWPDADEIERLGSGFRPGDAALGVHIPENGHLTPESCDQSFAMAREFFASSFPEHRARLGTCTSWLLDEQLAGLPATDLEHRALSAAVHCRARCGRRQSEHPAVRVRSCARVGRGPPAADDAGEGDRRAHPQGRDVAHAYGLGRALAPGARRAQSERIAACSRPRSSSFVT